jgi:hypothetical protein
MVETTKKHTGQAKKIHSSWTEEAIANIKMQNAEAQERMKKSKNLEDLVDELIREGL